MTSHDYESQDHQGALSKEAFAVWLAAQLQPTPVETALIERLVEGMPDDVKQIAMNEIALGRPFNALVLANDHLPAREDYRAIMDWLQSKAEE